MCHLAKRRIMRLGVVYQAWKNVISKPLKSVLTVTLLMFGISMISLFLLMERQLDNVINKNVKDIDLVLGASGSPLQLIMASVYHIDDPVGNISYPSAKRLVKNVHIESAIPLSYGDNYGGFRIVGTEHSYVELYNGTLQSGDLWSEPFQATIGFEAAQNLNLRVGDTFYSAHGLQDQSDVHTDKAFTVVGVLNPNGSVLDQLILTPLESIWNVHLKDGQVLAPENQEITAMLLQTRSKMGMLSFPKIAKNANMQAASPAIQYNKLTQKFGIGPDMIRAIAYIIIALSFASLFISVLENVRSRRHELALMRTMGGKPFGLFNLLILEGGMLTVVGTALGLMLSRVGLWIISGITESKFHYAFNDWALIEPELWIAGGAVAVGLLASAIPAQLSLLLNISKTLSES